MMGIRTDTVISSALSKDELRTIVNPRFCQYFKA